MIFYWVSRLNIMSFMSFVEKAERDVLKLPMLSQVKWKNNKGCSLVNNIDDPNKVLSIKVQRSVQRDKKILVNTKKTTNKRYDFKSYSMFEQDQLALLNNLSRKNKCK